MITIIIIFIIAKLAVAAVNHPKRKRKKKVTKIIKPIAQKADPLYTRQLQTEIKLQQQQRREEEKALKQAEKEYQQKIKIEAQAEKTRQRKEQAEADTLFYQNQLDTIISLLANVEDKINSVNWNIEIDKRTRSLDAMQKHLRQKEQLVKKQMQYENRVHTLESKIAKCYYIINS